MSRKAKIIIVSILILTTGLGLYFLFGKKAQPLPTAKLPQPKLQTAFEEEMEIISKLDKNKTKIPETISVYTLKTSPMVFEEMTGVAKSLGFIESPQKFKDVNVSDVYLWNEEVGYLRIVPFLRLVDYKSSRLGGETISDTFEEDGLLIQKAKGFITDRKILSSESFQLDKIRFTEIVQEGLKVTDKESARYAEVLFVEKINNYPVVNATADIGSVNVRLNKDGEIVSLYIERAAEIFNEKEYKTKTFSELEKTLSSAKLQSLGNLNLTDLTKNQVGKIEVFEANVAYLKEYNPNQTLMQPVFVLKGKTRIGSREFEVILYLPAISGEQLQ